MSLENYSPDAVNELAALSQQLAENPETRREFLKLTKRIKPDLTIPEIDMEERMSSASERNEARVQELEAKLQKREAMDELERRRMDLRKKNLVSDDEDVQAVEKIMLDKGITNHETAAEYHKWMKQSATPTPTGYNPSPLNSFNLKEYWKNPQVAARNEAFKALNDLRKPTRPIGL
jgi:predicted metal-dependent hydrolase